MKKISNIIGWIAKIYGGLVLLIPMIALIQNVIYGPNFIVDWRTYVLYSSLIIGLSIAYKWPLIGGLIATIGLIISGFIHPIVLPPGILYIVYWFIKRNNKNPIPSIDQKQ